VAISHGLKRGVGRCTLGDIAMKGTGRSPIETGTTVVKLQLGFEFSCAGVLPQVRRAQIIIILVITLLAWSLGGAPIVQVFTGAV
jgi:hypothetical protein